MTHQGARVSVQALMEDIMHLDTNPMIYDIELRKASYRTGYTVTVTFRTGDLRPQPSSLTSHADTPEDALRTMLIVLRNSWTKCPQCGNYRHGLEASDVES